MASLIRDAEIFSAEIRKVFGDLETKGFQFQTVSIKHTDAIGNYAEIFVSNAVTGRSLIFMYAPRRDLRPEGIAISLQNGSGDLFSIDEFLIHKKINSRMDDSLNLAKYEGSLETRFEGLLTASKKIIFQYLDKYLFGAEWESIPIHWGDLK